MTSIPPVAAPDQHARFSARLQWLTLALGAVSSVILLIWVSWRAAAGLAIGTLLAWLNYRWLDGGVGAIVSAALAQQGIPQPRVPSRVYLGFAGRYALIGLAAYATVRFLGSPVLAVFGGLLALGTAAIIESLYEVFTGPI